MTVNAGTLNIGSTLNAKTQVATAVQESASGTLARAGDITLKTGLLNLYSGGEISSKTYSAGNAGHINLNSGQVTITGSTNGAVDTGIFSTTESPAIGNAGNITVQTANLGLFNHSRISTSTASEGNAGNINITAPLIELNGNGVGAFIMSNAANESTGRNAKAGDIQLIGKDIKLVRGGYVLSVVSS